MKASVTHTSESRTKVQIEGETTNIAQWFTNLGGTNCDGTWIFNRSDANDVVEALKGEKYEITSAQLI